MTTENNAGSVAKLLDFLTAEHDLKNDAELAREFGVAPPVVSKWRNNHMPFGAKHILRAHEHFGIGVAEIRDRAALHH